MSQRTNAKEMCRMLNEKMTFLFHLTCVPHTIHGAWKIKTFIQLLYDFMFVRGIHNSYNSIN